MVGVLITPLVVIMAFSLAGGCSVTGNHKLWTMQQVLYNVDIVVYGNEKSRFDANDPHVPNAKHGLFEVYCVLKNDDPSKPLPTVITIEEVEPASSCSLNSYTPKTDIILGILRTGRGNFKWHEPNALSGSYYMATSENLKKAMHVCGMSDTVPTGRSVSTTPACPALDVSGTCSRGRRLHAGTHALLLMGILTVVSLSRVSESTVL